MEDGINREEQGPAGRGEGRWGGSSVGYRGVCILQPKSSIVLRAAKPLVYMTALYSGTTRKHEMISEIDWEYIRSSGIFCGFFLQKNQHKNIAFCCGNHMDQNQRLKSRLLLSCTGLHHIKRHYINLTQHTSQQRYRNINKEN